MVIVRWCLRAQPLRRLAGISVHSLAGSLVASVLLLCFAVAFGMANCGSITAWTPTENLGTSNPAHTDIPGCHAADPINCATGNLSEEQVDLKITGNGPPLEYTRYYNSQVAAAQTSGGTLGYGWSGSYSSKLTFSQEGEVATITHDNGSTITFAKAAEGSWNAPVWTQATFAQNGSNFEYTQPDRLRWEYSSAGRLLKVTDRHGVSLTLSYDGSGRLSSVLDQTMARGFHLTYNSAGQIEKVTDTMSRTVKYTYTSGSLSSVFLPGVETARWKFAYNASHEITALTDGRGFSTVTTYDAQHRATTQTDPLNRKYTFVYKETQGVDETTITEPNGTTTLEKFNGAGSPTSVTHAMGTSLEATDVYAYNSLFRVISHTDANKRVTSYTYDSRGNKLTEKDPNGLETKWTYNSANEVTSVTNPKGQVITITRNGAGDPLTVKRSAGILAQEDKFAYDSFGNMTKHTDPVGRVRIYKYDPAGWGQKEAEYLTSVLPSNLLRTWKYNLNSELVQTVDGRAFEPGNEEAAYATKITRDAQGRPTITTDPLGGTTKISYDGNGNVLSVTDGNEHVTSYTYDAASQRTEVKFPNGVTIGTTYDSMGKLATRTNGIGGATVFKRDGLGRIVQKVDPLGRETLYQFDLVGNLTKETDAESRAKTISYDLGYRQTKIDYSDPATSDVSFTYDNGGNIVEMIDGTGTTKRTFDGLDRPTEVVNGKGESVKYEYNSAGDVIKLTYPNGQAVTRTFDSAGRLEKVVDWFGQETKFTYYQNSQLKSTIYPSGSGNVDELSYNRRGEITKISMMKGLESLASFTYTRDKAGQVEKVDQTGFPGRPEQILYGYDAANRLLKSNGTNYQYDGGNSPLQIGPDTFAYDKAGQISTASTGSVSFNKVGQRTKSVSGGIATTYGYDQAGNLISVQRPAEGENPEISNTFKYDGSGLRATETNGASTYPMVWDAASSLPLLLRKGNDYYIYGPEGLPIEQIISSASHFLHHDQQGSTRILTSSTGNVIGSYEYSPYGAVWSRTGTQSTQMGYAGQYRSHGSALIYLRARTYDPATAQFLSVDPMVGQTGEPYTYAQANPINLNDPSGLTVYGACGSVSLSTGLGLTAGGTVCLTIDGAGNLGAIGYGSADVWDTVHKWADGLKNYVDRFKDLNKLNGSSGLRDILKGYFKGQISGEIGGLYSNADSVSQLSGDFWSQTTTINAIFDHVTITQFDNDKGVTGTVTTFGSNGIPWIGIENDPCEKTTIYSWSFSG